MCLLKMKFSKFLFGFFLQGEMTQLRAKLFNEENLIKKKMLKMQKDYDEKIGVLQRKINNLQVFQKTGQNILDQIGQNISK